LKPLVRMLEIVSVPEPVFVIVIGSGALAIPMPWLLKFRLAGDTLATGADTVPVPDNATECGLPEALSVITRFADLAELRLGVKVTPMVAVPPFAGTLKDVGVVMAKSPGFAPEIATPVT